MYVVDHNISLYFSLYNIEVTSMRYFSEQQSYCSLHLSLDMFKKAFHLDDGWPVTTQQLTNVFEHIRFEMLPLASSYVE